MRLAQALSAQHSGSTEFRSTLDDLARKLQQAESGNEALSDQNRKLRQDATKLQADLASTLASGAQHARAAAALKSELTNVKAELSSQCSTVEHLQAALTDRNREVMDALRVIRICHFCSEHFWCAASDYEFGDACT